MQGQPNMQGQPQIYVRGTDTSRYAGMALAFSVVGIVFNIISSLVGALFGTLGIIYGRKALTSQKKGTAKAGVVVGIIADVIAVIRLIVMFLAFVMYWA